MPYSPLAFAAGTLTVTTQPANGETVTIGGKVYTFQTTLTDVDGNVARGANLAAALQNLFDAINLTGTPGSQYAASMTENAHVKATTVTGTTVVVTAKVPGLVGNFIATAETIVTGGSWGGATLAGGTGSIYTALRELIATEQMNGGLRQLVTDLSDPAGAL